MKNSNKKIQTKVLLLGAITILAFGSCRRNRTCVCTDTAGGTDTTSIPFSKKKDAEAICTGYEDSFYTSCSLVK